MSRSTLSNNRLRVERTTVFPLIFQQPASGEINLKSLLDGGLRKNKTVKKTNLHEPLISIITVVFNGKEHLEQAILSVVGQTYKNIEYIIVDGGSTDGSLKIIQKYQNSIDYWVSEPDNGIYDAMNKGISLSSGDYIGFLNSDDILYRNTTEILALNAKNIAFDYTVGPVDVVSKVGDLEEKNWPLPNFFLKNRYIYQMATSHQSFFVSRKVISQVGLFDTRFLLRADYDLMIRVVSFGGIYFEFSESVGAFRKGGRSGGFSTFLENYPILRKHRVAVPKAVFFTMLPLVKILIVRSFPYRIVRWLRMIFASGRYTLK